MNKLLSTAGVALVLGSTVRGNFVNKGFETGNFSGWTLEYGHITGIGSCDISVAWTSTLPAGHPAPAVIDANSAPAAGQPIDVDPYCDTYMARINDVVGGKHATRLSQSFQVSDAEACPLPNAQYVSVTWGAMLQDGSHCQGPDVSKQAWFSIEVLVNGASVALTSVDATGASAPGSGWTQVAPTTWYKTMTSSLPFYAAAGDTVELALTAYDCSAGGHGGMAFLDCVDFGCSPTCGPNPVAQYTFHDISNLGLDSSGNGHEGILGAATPIISDCPFALHFLPNNNVNEFTIPHSPALDLIGPMTGMALIRPLGPESTDNDPSCTEGTIFSKGGNYWFQVGKLNDRLEFQNEGSGTSVASVPVDLCVGQWHHVAFVRELDGLTIDFYVDGLWVGTRVLSLPATHNTDDVMVGNYGFGSNPQYCEFNGDIDEIRIYDRALLPEEIMAAYHCGCPVNPCPCGDRDFCIPGYDDVVVCPCTAAPSTFGRGCGNKSNSQGARLTASGQSVLGGDTLAMLANGIPPNAAVFLRQGTMRDLGVTFGHGVYCLDGQQYTLFTGNALFGLAGFGYSAVRIGQTPPPTISVKSCQLGDCIYPCSTRYYQVMYTDGGNLGTCFSTHPHRAVNFTQGLSIVWQ